MEPVTLNALKHLIWNAGWYTANKLYLKSNGQYETKKDEISKHEQAMQHMFLAFRYRNYWSARVVDWDPKVEGDWRKLLTDEKDAGNADLFAYPREDDFAENNRAITFEDIRNLKRLNKEWLDARKEKS